MLLLTRLRAAVAGVFYRCFFRLLLLAVTAAQWACAAWVAALAAGWSPPWWVNLAGVGGLYAANRMVIARRGRGGGAFLRVYSATAFVSLFCAAFLLASTALWAMAHGVLGVLSAEAVTEASQRAVGAGLDGAFRWAVSLGMAAIALTMGYGYAFGQRALRVTRVPLRVGTAPGRGLRLVQISDIHVGQNLTLSQLRRFVDRVNALAPDLICITGDIADSPQADTARFFPLLGELRARHGVYAILGNHDHYAGADRVAEELRRQASVRVLRDRGVTLDLDGAPWHLIGLDDRGRDWARGVESDGRLAELLDAVPAGVPVLVLAHRPDVFRQAAAAGAVLMLAGHTHGGQIAVPWFGGRRRNLAEFVTAFDRGLYRCGASYLYVNCGLGVTGQRIRLFTPREITVFDLGGGEA